MNFIYPQHFGRRRFLGAAAATFAGAGLGLYAIRSPLLLPASEPKSEGLDSLARATAWLNSEPLTAAALRGKAVLVQFWTYTCINWLRTMPYMRVWAERYSVDGLVVIGVHSPEFAFERDIENVRNAVKDLRVNTRVALDNDFAIWRAFGNHYWPAVYLLDGEGRVRYSHFGEGEYARTERAIQELVGAQGVARGKSSTDVTTIVGQGMEADADWANLRSREAYVGKSRGDGFAKLSGDWTTGEWSALLRQPRGKMECRFHARDLHLVMRSANRAAIPFRVTLDSEAPAAAHGLDVDARGEGVLSAPRMYQLIRQPRPIVDRQFAIEFLNPGAEAFAFTFG
jgi:thiol-disulfide isomerase/thioredoxin